MEVEVRPLAEEWDVEQVRAAEGLDARRKEDATLEELDVQLREEVDARSVEAGL